MLMMLVNDSLLFRRRDRRRERVRLGDWSWALGPGRGGTTAEAQVARELRAECRAWVQ